MTIYKVDTQIKISPADPLHVSNFYNGFERHNFKKMNDRQALILYLANIHAEATKRNMPLGFCEIPMRLTKLREWVYDYEIAFNYFFTIKRLGYNLGDNFECSLIIPNKLNDNVTKKISKTTNTLSYLPPSLPDYGVISKVFVKRSNKETILKHLRLKSRLDLLAPVNWLLNQKTDEINFYFAKAGKLQQRDTSIWPILSIETWPSWLREELFGTGIDIESAYTQFLLENIYAAHKNRPAIIPLMYSDLIRSLEDKKEWRREICEDILGMENTDENISTVKKLCMSLANGSKISPAILTSNNAFSVTRDIVIQKTDNISHSNLTKIGERLSRISNQYINARKTVCLFELGLNPTRKNQKKVFSSYFEWERIARYKIWESVDRHGIMVHDGIDGIPEQYLKDMPKIIKELNLKLTT